MRQRFISSRNYYILIISIQCVKLLRKVYWNEVELFILENFEIAIQYLKLKIISLGTRMNTLDKEKKRLADQFRRDGYIINNRIHEAFLKVPREEFVLEEDRQHAYEDHPLPVVRNQTISAPHMCILILSYGDFKPNQKVLEVGSGTGYQAALISEMVKPGGFVYGIERHEILAEMGMQNLERTGYSEGVLVIAGDGTL